MIQTVMSLALPVNERLLIRKNRIEPRGRAERNNRIAVVTGMHGDELEGQYVCYELARRLMEQPEYLKGTVDIYPALNPLVMDLGSRNLPKTEMDMNRTFPGSVEGTVMERIAASIIDDIAGALMCVDVHASDKFIREIPQVRLNETFADKLLYYAKCMNVDIIWTNATRTVDESTLAYTLNMLGVPSFAIEMGIGNQINQGNGNQLVDGIFNLMHELGVWNGPPVKVRTPFISKEGEVEFIRASVSGVFVPERVCHQILCPGAKIGRIINSFTGEIEQEYFTKTGGLVFSLREYPMVYEGALLARIFSQYYVNAGEEKII